MAGTHIQIIGLKELRRDLRSWDRKAPRLVTAAHRKIAKEVKAAAQSKASSLGSVAAKSAPAIGHVATMTGAGVKLDGVKHPYALGAEFGALQYPQFKPWTGNSLDAGYFLYPTIRAKQSMIRETYSKTVLDELVAGGLGIDLSLGGWSRAA